MAEGVAGRRGRKAWPESREVVGEVCSPCPWRIRMNVARTCTNTVTYITVLSEFSRLQPQTSPSGFGVETLMSASKTVMSDESCDLRSESAQVQATGAVQQGLRQQRWLLHDLWSSSISPPGALKLTTGRLRPGPVWELRHFPKLALRPLVAPSTRPSLLLAACEGDALGLCWWTSYASL